VLTAGSPDLLLQIPDSQMHLNFPSMTRHLLQHKHVLHASWDLLTVTCCFPEIQRQLGIPCLSHSPRSGPLREAACRTEMPALSASPWFGLVFPSRQVAEGHQDNQGTEPGWRTEGAKTLLSRPGGDTAGWDPAGRPREEAARVAVSISRPCLRHAGTWRQTPGLPLGRWQMAL
jgi:hypothetical protein